MLKPYQKCYVRTIEGSRLDCIFRGYDIYHGSKWAFIKRMDTGATMWVPANTVYKDSYLRLLKILSKSLPETMDFTLRGGHPWCTARGNE